MARPDLPLSLLGETLTFVFGCREGGGDSMCTSFDWLPYSPLHILGETLSCARECVSLAGEV